MAKVKDGKLDRALSVFFRSAVPCRGVIVNRAFDDIRRTMRSDLSGVAPIATRDDTYDTTNILAVRHIRTLRSAAQRIFHLMNPR